MPEQKTRSINPEVKKAWIEAVQLTPEERELVKKMKSETKEHEDIDMTETFENGSIEICKDGSVLCWINTEALPVEIIRLGIFRYVKTENKYNFSELCKVLYRHPQVPDMSVVSLLDWINVDVPYGTETTFAYAIDGVKGIQSVAKLSLPECYNGVQQKIGR